jgi:hypothetical protein
MSRTIYKTKEVMDLLRRGMEADIEVCSFDKSRPNKSGKRIFYRGIKWSSDNGFLLANARLQNGDPISFHPCLIEKYNGVPVMP